MKMAIKYISPLLICGLILPLYNISNIYTHTRSSVGHLNPSAGQNIFVSQRIDSSFTEKIMTMETKQQMERTSADSFSFFRDVISNILPVLKNLK
jgi:hypothetical protein